MTLPTDYGRTLPLGGASGRALLRLHLDPWLLLGLGATIAFGLLVLYSASHRDVGTLTNQMLRISVALALMVAAAHLNPRFYLRWAPGLYVVGIALLIAVLLFGTTVQGAQRWLDLPGLPRFQPSELMKLAVPLAIAWYFHSRPLPPRIRHVLVALGLCIVPTALIVPQPDLGTGVMVAAGGVAVIVMAGIRWRVVGALALLAALASPALWFVMTPYQKGRVLTFLDPERQPQDAGWNIIQSKAAIGSGGFSGKDLFSGTQSQLDFLPESQTDFIIAVIGEELGLVGITLLLVLYLLVVARALLMATEAQDTFGRLAAGGLTLVFFAYVFVNVGMVSGLLPVVGVPLPLVSYGGTSAVTLLFGFGIVMSIHSHGTR